MPDRRTVLRLDPGTFRRHLRAMRADRPTARKWSRRAGALFSRLTGIRALGDSDSIRLDLTVDELHALHTLLDTARLDLGHGRLVGPVLEDWRDPLDALHRRTTALVDRADPAHRKPGNPP